MKTIKSVLLLIYLFMQFPFLYADWEPEFLNLNNADAEQVLKTPELNDLKTRVSQYLQNSWCSEEKSNMLIELIVLSTPNVCVEIGVFTGSTALPILASLKFCGQGQLYAIDAWSCDEAIYGLPSSEINAKWWGALDMPAIHEQFNHLIKSWLLDEYCQVLPTPSNLAVHQIPPIDFLHLDGNFSEEGALLDSKLYVPKVKSGGYVLLSNVHVMIEGRPSKMKALTVLLDYCKVICEIDNGQTLLFKKT